MSEFGFLPSGSGMKFGAHLETLDEPARSLMVDLCSFARSLGSNIIEEIRPHRVVYAKTMSFRTFLDIEPAKDHIVVEVRVGRQTPPVQLDVRTQSDVDSVKKLAADAYQKIR